MDNIQALLHKVLQVYLAERSASRTVSNTSTSYDIIVKKLPQFFKDYGHLSSDILIEGSNGKGNITLTPWICFFDKTITTSAQNGYYVSILFREDMEGFYLSLNQGWTQYQTSFGVKQGRKEISNNAIKARSILQSLKGFEGDSLNLNTIKTLGRGYEKGNIYSRYYSVNNLPSDKKLIADLQLLLGAYRELKGLVGRNILNIQSIRSEGNFQLDVHSSERAVIPNGPLLKPSLNSKSPGTNWARSTKISKHALENANYLCEFDSKHTTFISKFTRKQFVEVHHLIPMEKQSDFEVSLDVPENIIALCPNCHRLIHLASKEEKEPMLRRFLKTRNRGLLSRGISINFDNLTVIYKNIDLIEL